MDNDEEYFEDDEEEETTVDSLKVIIEHGRHIAKKKIDTRMLIKPKSALERIFGRKTHLKDHYFSDGTKVTEETIRDVLNEPSPFKYPEEKDEFAYKVMTKAWDLNRRRAELALKYNERNNYVTRHERDMLNRLYVRAEDVKSAKTILDIDSEFYSIVEGRPIAEKFNIQDYIKNIRDVLRTKIVTGYRRDDALLIEENLFEEQNAINNITKSYDLYVATFEDYLSQDHKMSMNLIRESEEEAKKAFEMYKCYKKLSKEYGSLKSQVSNLEEKWRNCKMFQRFLFMISPLHWRKQHDYIHMTLKDENGSLELTEARSAEFDPNNLGSEYRSIEELIDYFLEDCKTTPDPELYFKEPWELLKVFRFIELQNLNSLLHSEELAVPLENVKHTMALAEENYNNQINDLREIIDNLEGEILWEEERACTLELLARELINGAFKRLISDESTLNLHVIVEDVYEGRIAPNDANLSAFDMMKAIEIKFREFMLKLDYISYDKVQKAEHDCYMDQARIMKLAEDASRKVIQIERLVYRLRKILEPPVEVKKKELKFRSMLHRPKEQISHDEVPLSPEELEYLYLFTDFCPETDNIQQYRNIMQRELELEEQVKREQEEAAEDDEV